MHEMAAKAATEAPADAAEDDEMTAEAAAADAAGRRDGS